MINPRSMPEVTAAVRSNVTEELHELAGLTVDAVDVAVATIVQQTTTSNTRTVECAPPSPVPTAPPPLSTATRIPGRHRCNSRRRTPTGAPAAAPWAILLALAVLALGVVGIRDALVTAGAVHGSFWTQDTANAIDGLTPRMWIVPRDCARRARRGVGACCPEAPQTHRNSRLRWPGRLGAAR